MNNGEVLHSSVSTFLLVGTERSLLFDTGAPGHWASLEESLDEILDGRELDWVVPTHPEVPHAGNLPELLRKYGNAQVGGDVRDYHLYYPEFAARFGAWPVGKTVPLGGGYQFTVRDAIIKDLPNTVWGYEARERVLFVADAFQYAHNGHSQEESLHRPGECRLLSTELPKLPDVEQAMLITRAALAWTRYSDASGFVDSVVETLATYPARFVAPTHGNVIDDFDSMLPIMRQAYTQGWAAKSTAAAPSENWA